MGNRSIVVIDARTEEEVIINLDQVVFARVRDDDTCILELMTNPNITIKCTGHDLIDLLRRTGIRIR